MASYLSKLQHFRWNWCEITPSALCLDVEWFFNRLNIRFTEIATTSILSFVSTTWMKGLVDRTVERSQKMNQLPKHNFEKFRQMVCKTTIKYFHKNFQDSVQFKFTNCVQFWKGYVIFTIFFSLTFPNRFLFSSLSSADLTEMPHAPMTFTTSLLF